MKRYDGGGKFVCSKRAYRDAQKAMDKHKFPVRSAAWTAFLTGNSAAKPLMTVREALEKIKSEDENQS